MILSSFDVRFLANKTYCDFQAFLGIARRYLKLPRLETWESPLRGQPASLLVAPFSALEDLKKRKALPPFWIVPSTAEAYDRYVRPLGSLRPSIALVSNKTPALLLDLITCDKAAYYDRSGFLEGLELLGLFEGRVPVDSSRPENFEKTMTQALSAHPEACAVKTGVAAKSALEGLIASLDEKSGRVADSLEEACRFWYREVPMTSPEAGMRERYLKFYEKMFLEIENVQKDLPGFLQEIFRYERDVNDKTLRDARFLGWTDECAVVSDIRGAFLEGCFYWLTRVGQDLRELREGFS